MIEDILLTTARLTTHQGGAQLSNATGFFFERDERLFLITSRHVVHDPANGHLPDRLVVELHDDPDNLASAKDLSILLYQKKRAIWHQAEDSAGEVDVAVIEIDRAALPKRTCYAAFTPAHLLDPSEQVEVGSELAVVGFPLGFHDTLHHMPVVRHACLASSFGFRFQGQGFFLTDARTHRGISGAPVVMRAAATGAPVPDDPLPWRLLGIHSARLDVGVRDLQLDEALGLNCSWYADVLEVLTGS